MSKRDSGGRLLPGQSGNPAGGARNHKLFTRAVDELMCETLENKPSNWSTDANKWTRWQYLAEYHWRAAKSGDIDSAQLLIGRSEGKIPTAPEDREVGMDIARRLTGGIPALRALQQALGLAMTEDVIDAEIVQEVLGPSDPDRDPEAT